MTKMRRELSDEEYKLVEFLRDAREQRKQWEEEEQRARQALLNTIDDATLLAYNGDVVAEIENRKITRFNRKQFQEDWPKFDEMYRTEATQQVVTLIESNERI